MHAPGSHHTDVDSRCRSCGDGLDHCHGTLITHDDDTRECTVEDCSSLDQARHELSISCAELPSCGCLTRTTTQFAAVG